MTTQTTNKQATQPKKYKKDYKEYQNWIYMIADCYPGPDRSTSYERKGIEVQEGWRGEQGFWEFLRTMGPKPSQSHYFIRIDKAKDFTEDNCAWSTNKYTTQKND